MYFPGDTDQRWFDTVSRKEYHGSTTVTVAAPIDFIPVYQRGGTIVPKQMRVRRSSQLMVRPLQRGGCGWCGWCFVLV
jgi:alpha 1,3-glucosidase